MKGISLGAKPQAKEDISSFKNFKFSFSGFFVFSSVISIFVFLVFSSFILVIFLRR